MIFPAGRFGGCVPAPPLLSQATNSQPVETGSDWEIPSRFSFQPMAPRKVWTGVPPTAGRDWPPRLRRLPARAPIGQVGRPSISIRSSAHAATPPGEKKRADSRAEWTSFCTAPHKLHSHCSPSTRLTFKTDFPHVFEIL